jgi:hypothetical protein
MKALSAFQRALCAFNYESDFCFPESALRFQSALSYIYYGKRLDSRKRRALSIMKAISAFQKALCAFKAL